MKKRTNKTIAAILLILVVLFYSFALPKNVHASTVFQYANGISTASTFTGHYGGSLDGTVSSTADGGYNTNGGYGGYYYFWAANRYTEAGKIWNFDGSYTLTFSADGWPGTFNFWVGDANGVWYYVGSSTIVVQNGVWASFAINGNDLPIKNVRYFRAGRGTSGALDMFNISIDKTYSLPNAPTITSPSAGSIQNTHTPTVNWNFSAPDAGYYQGYYEIVASNNGWASWYYDSGVVTSGNQWATLPSLPDGNWNVAVRTWDQTGSWTPPWGYGNFIIDTTPPTYTSANVQNIDSNGYDVYVYGVGDATSGVNRVQFPTWTDYNGQDDIQPNWGTNPIATGTNLGGGTWKYHVDKAAHNNELGQYHTAAYIYDNAGNYLGIGGLDAYLKLNQSAPTVPVASSITATTVVLTSSAGSQITSNGVTKASGSTWTGLSPVTAYTAYAYLPGDATHNQSPNSANANYTTLLYSQSAPTVPIYSNVTATTVVLTSFAGSQITCNGVTKASGSTWTMLSPATAYTAFAYLPGDATHYQSPNSANANFTTHSLPNPPIITAPTNGTTLATHTPTITWNFSDPDVGAYQGSYQVVGSNDNWVTWYYNSGVIQSGSNTINATYLPDGNWQFAVKTWDQTGLDSSPWGYCNFVVKGDTIPPTIVNGMDAAIRYTNAADGTMMRFNTTNGADTGGSGYDATYFWCKKESGTNDWFLTQQKGTPWGTNNWYYDVPIQGEGTYLVRAYPRDNAGNWNWSSYVDERYIVDRQPPNAPTIKMSRQGMGNIDVILSLIDNGDNGDAGVASMQIQMDGSSWLTYTGQWVNGDPWGLPVGGWHTVSARAIDNAGNVSATSTSTYGTDTTPPTLSLVPSTTAPTSSAVTITATASDSLSGVSRIQLPNGTLVYAATATYSVSTNGTYTFNAWDNAGNQSIQSIIISNINTVPIVPSLSNPAIFDSAEEAAKAGYYPDPNYK